MYLLIIFVFLTAIVIFFVGRTSNPFNWWASPGIIFVSAIIYGILISGLRSNYADNNDLNYRRYIDLPIASFANKEGWSVSGGFVLGTGGFSGGSYDYYITYGKFKRGLKRMKLSPNTYYLDESNRKRPCIEKYWYVDGKKAFESKWFWNREASEDEFMHENYGEKTVVIPPGTVLKHFDVKD